MEKRDKESRLNSLQKLKKLRHHKGGEAENGPVVEQEEENGIKPTNHDNDNDDEGHSEHDDNSNSEHGSEDDLNDFIENDESSDNQSEFYHRKSGPAMSKFFRKTSSTTSKATKASLSSDGVDESALKDDFFKTLVAQLSDDDEEKTAEPSVPTKKRAKKEKKAKKSKGSKAEDSSSDEEFVPTTTDLSVSFPEPAPESALNQLQINNILAMEIDMEVDEEDQVFLDEADLNQFEQEMSFILEDQDKTDVKAVDVVSASDNKNVTLEPSSSYASDNKNVTLETSSAMNDTDGSILFYWFDAYERQPNGPVHLFGKMQDPRSPTGTTTSCVIIENMQRNLYFLPRDNSTPFEDLQAEVSDIARQYGINKFGCKRVTRKYAFELPGIPSESEYLKLVYPFDSNPQLPLTLSGRTFSHVFGTNTGALEMFLIKRKIMGPSWLKLQPTSISGRTAISWCKSEIRVGDPKGIHALAGNDVPPPPLMTAMSVSLRTIMNPETRAHEIVSISGLVYDSVDVDGSRTCATDRPRCSAAFTVVRMDLEAQQIAQIPSTSSNIRVEPAKSEKALLNYFLAMLQRHDPDILIGHNFLGFDLGVLLHRMRNCKVDFWSKLGRLNWTHWPKSKGAASQQGGGSTEASYAERQILSGRIVCDTYLTAKDLVKAKNYSLGTLAASQLGLERTPFDYERVKEYFASPQLLREMLTGSEMDAYYAAMLMFQMLVLPLTLQLTNIAGNLWSRTLTGARAERNEFLLLHEFHNNKFICPDKQPFSSSAPSFTIGTTDNDEESATTAKSSTSSRRKPAYSGGLVLEPKKGFYDRIVLLLDFNSLYPSIIQEYNICFTTVERGAENNVAEERTGPNDVPPVPDSSLPQGVLPRILKTLVERRRAVKSMMKKEAKLSESQLASLNIRQLALKLTANSMYGCLGFSHSRFYAKPLAILITAKGREILQSTVNLTRDVCQSDVIYGDTDSIMVNTRTLSLVDARALGQKIKRTVNEHYRLLEIELDAVFQKLLLLKKKKYAALIVDAELPDGSLSTRLETKGLDLVRRDWCPLSVDASTTILNEIMYAHADPEEIALRVHESLRLVAQDLKQDKIPLEKFIISKNLTKEPGLYADARTQPHVTVALRMRQKGLSASSGDTIPYVICQQSSAASPSSNSSSLADFAYHPDEVRKDQTLRIDVSWYLQTQLHPPIARLCEHIEGSDSGQLAACLGLDPRKFRSSSSSGSSSNSSEDSLLSSSASSRFASLLTDEERFANTEKLKVSCPSCAGVFEFAGIIKEIKSGETTTNENAIDGNSSLVSQMSCMNCSAPLPIVSLYYALVNSFIRANETYNSYWMKCDDVACQLETERLGVYDRKCPAEGCRSGVLRPLLPHAYMYTHLLYLRSLLSTEKFKSSKFLSPNDTKLLQQLSHEVSPLTAFIDQKMRSCAYPVIDFKEIFNFLNV